MKKKGIGEKMKSIKRIVACTMAGVLALSGMTDTAVTTARAAVKKPTLVKTAKVTVNKTKKISVKKGGYKIKSIKWSSSKKKVAAVKGNGKAGAIIKGVSAGKATIKAVVKTKKSNKKFTLKCKVTVVKASSTSAVKPAATGKPKLDKKGYTLKWEDEFEGDKLNRDDWNVELHQAGWVNSEQQEYVDSTDNIEVKDGKLVIKPKKTGEGTYTSGRVNTQNKHDFKYGIFEARLKFPKGQGYLPAFWMMPTDENLYGQWPKCGEIDIAEVMGQQTDKLYGTIHYGEPHKETQGTYNTPSGEKDFYEDYHNLAVEWVPGRITWYVDGIKYHEARDWFTAKPGDDPLTFPAPFDQKFYMILNLAVGGSWVGMVDDATIADMDNQSYSIDYVRAYQLDSYGDENVSAVSASEGASLRDPDAAGNYIINGDFSKAEDLESAEGWQFMLAQGGEAAAAIADKSINIKTTNAGSVDYSVQLVQAGLPMVKDSSYRLSFDARSTELRKLHVAIQGPDQGWIAYMPQETVEIGTEKKTYTYDFTVRQSTDPNGRLDFNLGALGSTADVELSNVVLTKTADNVAVEKSVRSDGNYVYNGGFDQGESRLGNWEILNRDKAYISVENKDNIRRLKVVAPGTTTKAKPVMISQSGLGLLKKGVYELSYKASKVGAKADKSISISYDGIDFAPQEINDQEKEYSESFELDKDISRDEADLTIMFTSPGTYYLDDVRLSDNALIKNGSFSNGLSGWSPFLQAPASATYVIDSLNEDNAFDITIDDTGADDNSNNWYIQLNQFGVQMIQGKTYKLSFKAKSSLDRSIQYNIGHNGETDNDWTSYSDYQNAALTSEYKTFEVTFTMNAPTDLNSRFNITMGTLDKRITAQHRICIDDVVLEEI
ncbi:MAG TPA: glucan endo-1,3-beta-D-glucosidase [Lachnospiraceae bacterium]|nr:glucan endo-1,3-beta-D-glucosidase [Lachnospiraceae bacterium]